MSLGSNINKLTETDSSGSSQSHASKLADRALRPLATVLLSRKLSKKRLQGGSRHMNSRKRIFASSLGLAVAGLYLVTTAPLAFSAEPANAMRFVQLTAKSKEDRSAIANLGVSIEATRTDSVWGFANQNSLRRLK